MIKSLVIYGCAGSNMAGLMKERNVETHATCTTSGRTSDPIHLVKHHLVVRLLEHILDESGDSVGEMMHYKQFMSKVMCPKSLSGDTQDRGQVMKTDLYINFSDIATKPRQNLNILGSGRLSKPSQPVEVNFSGPVRYLSTKKSCIRITQCLHLPRPFMSALIIACHVPYCSRSFILTNSKPRVVSGQM